MTFPSWPNVNYEVVTDEDYVAIDAAVQAIDAVIPPEVPPEVWQTTPVDSERAMQAVRAMSRGQ